MRRKEIHTQKDIKILSRVRWVIVIAMFVAIALGTMQILIWHNVPGSVALYGIFFILMSAFIMAVIKSVKHKFPYVFAVVGLVALISAGVIHNYGIGEFFAKWMTVILIILMTVLGAMLIIEGIKQNRQPSDEEKPGNIYIITGVAFLVVFDLSGIVLLILYNSLF